MLPISRNLPLAILSAIALSALTGPAASQASAAPVPEPRAHEAESAELWATRPLGFEANAGQLDERAAFVARGSGYAVFLTPSAEAVTVLRGSDAGGQGGRVIRMRPHGRQRRQP